MKVLSPDDIDFAQYLRETDTKQKVKPADAYLDDYLENAINPKQTKVCTLPWDKTASTFNFRQGEVTVYAGQNGSGKSMITGQIALGLIKQNYKVCIASFEMKPVRSVQRMLRQFACENIEAPRYSSKDVYLNNIVRRFKAFSDDRLWFYDQQGTVSPTQVVAVVRYCATELGIQHIFIDSLMKCVSAEDDYNQQKYFVDELTAIARDHNVHIHLVHHIRKGNGDEAKPSKTDIKGTGAIADQVDNIFLVWRNKSKEHKIQNNSTYDHTEYDALLMCEKQRNGEAEEWYSLWYDRASQQFLDVFGAVPNGFDAAGQY